MKWMFCLVVCGLLGRAQALGNLGGEGARGITSQQSQGAPPLTANKNQMIVVPEKVLLIEEDGLPPDPSLQGSNRPGQYATPGARTAALMTEDLNHKDNGIKLYRFILSPGELLATHILCDPSDVVTQRFGFLSGPSFIPSADSKGQLSRVNRLSRQQRTHKIQYKNNEHFPVPLLLVVYGATGYSYRIQITRAASH